MQRSKGAKNARSKSKSKADRSSMTYAEMITDGLMTLNEKGGSTRQELWKCVSSKFEKADYKLFLARLKKYSREGGMLKQMKNKQRFKLASSVYDGIKKRVDRGMSFKKALEQIVKKVPLKQVKRKDTKKALAEAARKKKAANKRAKQRRQEASKAKGKGKGKGASKSAGKGKSKGSSTKTKDKIKQKAKDNKKTKGGAKANQKVD